MNTQDISFENRLNLLVVRRNDIAVGDDTGDVEDDLVVDGVDGMSLL